MSQTGMIPGQRPDEEEVGLAAHFEQIPGLFERDPDLVRRGAWFDTRFQVGIGSIPFDVTVQAGRIVSIERGPLLMRSWRFAIRGSAEAWRRHWQPVPEPGWHDLFALSKRGVLRMEGDLWPLVANLQYVKDLVALPRRLAAEVK
jgi:hypothetical protein